MEFKWVRLLFGPSVNADASNVAGRKSGYHLIRGGFSHAQSPPRQRLRCVLGTLSNLEVKVLWPN